MRATITILKDGIRSEFQVDHEDTRVSFQVNPIDNGVMLSNIVNNNRIRNNEEGMRILKDLTDGVVALQKVKNKLEKEILERA
jgi:hypothetical protein